MSGVTAPLSALSANLVYIRTGMLSVALSRRVTYLFSIFVAFQGATFILQTVIVV